MNIISFLFRTVGAFLLHATEVVVVLAIILFFIAAICNACGWFDE